MKKTYKASELRAMERKIARKFTETYSPRFRVEKTTKDGKPALTVSCGAMYETPQWKGKDGVIGMLTFLRDTLGGKFIDEDGTTKQSGCETCDYGSFYSREFIVW